MDRSPLMAAFSRGLWRGRPSRIAILVPRAVPIAISLLTHVALGAVVAGHAVSAGTGPARPELSIDVETVTLPAPPSVDAPADDTAQATAHAGHVATHHHSYPVPPDHDAHPHDPNLVHAPFAPAAPATETAPPVVEAPASEPPRFVLSSTRVPGTSGATAHASRRAGSSASDSAASSEGPMSESRVSTPARLVARAPVDYPPEARQAAIEADVPVEIVVDVSGVVVQARALAQSGFGLDAAAVRAVRAYRFSPALHDGRRVSVRMRWNVQFRLRG